MNKFKVELVEPEIVAGKEIKEIEDFIERFRYKATKAKQVQSRIKMLERIDRVEVDLVDTSSIHFRFPPAPSSGKVVVEAINYAKSYGDKEVLKPLDLVILKNEFIAFVGKNGIHLECVSVTNH
jgi:ATP-binding cassette subfamily F protein 3